MTLVASPPSILGGVVPHPGLGSDPLGNMEINGWRGATSELGGSLEDATIDFKLDGTATLGLVVNDNHRTLLRSKLTQWKSWVGIDGVGFMLSGLQKTGTSLTLTFDHETVAYLQMLDTPTAVAAGTMSRSDFIRKLASTVSSIQVLTPGGDTPGMSAGQLTVGNVDPTTGAPVPTQPSTSVQQPETFWQAMGRVLDEIGWRRFVRGADQLYVVSDQWLVTQPPIYVLDESSPGVDVIDFEWDSRQPVARASIYCRAESWAYPVGSVIELTEKMGIAAGMWLVDEISRSLLSSSAVVTIAQAQPTIPESALAAATGGDTAAAAVAAATGGDTTAGLDIANGGVLTGQPPMPSNTSAQANQALAQQMAAGPPWNWTGSQWIALNKIGMQESGWSVTAKNPSSGALGIPQALPPSKLLDTSQGGGPDGYTNPATQIRWMLTYIKGRYGDPVSAWNFHLAHNWY